MRYSGAGTIVGERMKPIQTDDLILSMSVLWQKFADVTVALEQRLRLRGESDLERVMSRSWAPLRTLIGEGLAEQEVDRGTIVCRLTKAGTERKRLLLEPAAASQTTG